VDGRATNLAYDQANRLVGYGSVATYGYDGDGLRMSKTLARDPQFTWDVAEGLPLIIQDGSTSYVTGPGGLPLEQVGGPDGRSVLYYHQDQLGSTRALTDGSGAVVQTYRYDPYGNLAASSGSTSNPFRFAGQYLDTESGLYYLRARYYDPATAQFVSVDPVVGRTGQPYVYVADSPLNGVDPGGLSVAPCDDERCKELKRFVNDLTNGLRSKGRDIETNPKDLPESGVRAHQERWLGWQRGLQRLLGELAARGCDTQGVDAEAPSWANAPVPQPNVQPRPDPTQSVAAAPQHPWWIPGAVAAGGTAVVVIWFIGKLASPVCGPALPACAVAF
jgi:RHS repeat-associated protein